MATPGPQAAQSSRRDFLRTAPLVLAVSGSVAATLTTPSTARAAGSERHPQQPYPFLNEDGDIIVKQPADGAKFSKAELGLVIGSIMSEIAEVMGLPRSTGVSVVADKMIDPNFAEGKFFDPMGQDCLVELAKTGRRYMAIMTMNGVITNAVGRALNKPEVRALASGIVLFGRYRDQTADLKSASIETPRPR